MSNPEPLIFILPILLIVAIAVSIWYFVFRNKCSEVATPYYNKKSKKCEVCPAAKPTWDAGKKMCQAAIDVTNVDPAAGDAAAGGNGAGADQVAPTGDDNTIYVIKDDMMADTTGGKLVMVKDMARSDSADVTKDLCNSRNDCKGVTCVKLGESGLGCVGINTKNLIKGAPMVANQDAKWRTYLKQTI